MMTYDVIMTPSDEGCWVLKSAAVKEIRHQKYKRCLAMAKIAIKDDYLPWNMKWHKRWLELAEKFKEVK